MPWRGARGQGGQRYDKGNGGFKRWGPAMMGAMGGGDVTPGYDEASTDVSSGVLSSPGEGYDPAAATSPKGVLTPELQAAYNQGPYQPLNWMGKLSGKPDMRANFLAGQRSSQDALAAQKAMVDYHNQAALAQIPLTTSANIAATGAVADAERLRQARELQAYHDQQAALHPGELVPLYSPEDLKYRMGAQVHQGGIPMTLEHVLGAEARIPAAPEAALAGQNLGMATSNLGALEADQNLAFRKAPENQPLVQGNLAAQLQAPVLRAGGEYLNNLEAMRTLRTPRDIGGILYGPQGQPMLTLTPAVHAGPMMPQLDVKGNPIKDAQGNVVSKPQWPGIAASLAPVRIPAPSGGGSFVAPTGAPTDFSAMPGQSLFNYPTTETAPAQPPPPPIAPGTKSPVSVSSPQPQTLMPSLGSFTSPFVIPETADQKAAKAADEEQKAQEARRKALQLLQPYQMSY